MTISAWFIIGNLLLEVVLIAYLLWLLRTNMRLMNALLCVRSWSVENGRRAMKSRGGIIGHSSESFFALSNRCHRAITGGKG